VQKKSSQCGGSIRKSFCAVPDGSRVRDRELLPVSWDLLSLSPETFMTGNGISEDPVFEEETTF